MENKNPSNIYSEKKEKTLVNVDKNLITNALLSITDGFVMLDYNEKYIYINDIAAKLLGKDADFLIGKSIWKEFPEKEGDLFYDNYQKAVKNKIPYQFKNFYQPWGKWFENRIIPSNDGVLIFFQEISDDKKHENKIKEAYNIINKSSSVAVLCKNEYNFPVVFASENTIDLFGYTHYDFLKNRITIDQLVHKDDLQYIQQIVFKLAKATVSQSVKPNPFRIVTKDGVEKWVQCNLDAIVNNGLKPSHIQGIVEDITDRKKTEDLFFKSNQRLQDTFNHTPLASIIFDLDFKVIEWNNSATRVFGYTVDEAKGKHAKDLIIPNYFHLEIDAIFKGLLEEKSGYRSTNENKTKCGKTIICDWYNVTLKDADGHVTGVASLADDITERIESKRLLEKSEKKYRDIFEKSYDAVFMLSNGILTDCNKAALKIFGYDSKEEFLQTHPAKISPEKQPCGENSYSKADKMIDIAIEKGSNRFRWYHKKRNGKSFPTEVTLTKIDEKDGVDAIHVVVKDITDKVRNEAVEKVVYTISKEAISISDFNEFSTVLKNELNTVIDTSNLYLAVYNKLSNTINISFVVDELEEIKEFSAKKSLTGLVIHTKKPMLISKEQQEKLIKEGTIEQIGSLSQIWMGVPLFIKKEVFGALVLQSYTDKNAYNQSDLQLLEFVANQLSSIIQRKNAENNLKEALQKAQESDKLKSAFLANMSHEIRTPMNGIIGFSELLANPSISASDRNKYAQIVVNSSKQLLTIVNDILDISKIEAGAIQLHYEHVNINKLLNNLYEFYKPIALEKKLEIKLVNGLENLKSVIDIDKTKLNQVLTNLLSNSFKFTKTGSVIFGYELIDQTLRFFVKDTGIGIAKELHEKIFDRFIQADYEVKNQNRGTGLGLAISKKFVEMFKGNMWLDSDANGTTVYFTVPYQKSKTTAISTVIEKKPIEDNVNTIESTVLVAEDEEYNMLYIKELFSNTKIKIIEAFDGEAAVKLALENPAVQLVLMDIKMPKLNGVEAMKAIKKVRPQLPIVVLSAFAMESDRELSVQQGFDAYLSKPIDKKKLFALISQFCSTK